MLGSAREGGECVLPPQQEHLARDQEIPASAWVKESGAQRPAELSAHSPEESSQSGVINKGIITHAGLLLLPARLCHSLGAGDCAERPGTSVTP